MKKTIAVLALLAAPALASAQAGLSRVSYLALQQELRDQGCGVTNVDGRYGPQTRRAIATCAKKFNSANNAAALLAAMNIGFGPNDNPPSGGTGTTGSASTDMSMGAASGTTETATTTTHKKRTTKKAKAAAKAAADSTKQ
jgi:peptidoglycan hydrolase-like protein with peptidoglycan-binding domain